MREAARLRRTTDVQRARREGTSRGDRMYLVTVVGSLAPTSRLAVRVPKHLGSAVTRNRARRRARAAFGPLLPRLARPSDVLVMVRAPAVKAPFGDLAASAETLLAEQGPLDRL